MSYGRDAPPVEGYGGDYDGSYRWWDEDDPLECLWHSYERFCRLENRRLMAHRRWARLYGVRERSPDPWDLGFDTDRLTLNVVKACVDAVTAKIGKQRPRPQPQTDGGNATLVRKAMNLQRYLDAQFRRGEYYRLASQVFRDAALFGTGLFAVFRDGDNVRYQRVMSDEVLVDPTEGRFGDHRTMIRRRWVSRDVLCKKFPKHEAAILATPEATDTDWAVTEYGASSDRTNDLVLLIEGIHLPSDDEAGDGKRILALRNVVLSEQPWKHEYFPVVRVCWTQPVVGYWGTGLAEELWGIHVEIQRILQKIQASMHLVAVPRVFIPIGAKVQAPQMDNRIGALVHYSGPTPPTVMNPAAASPDMYAHLWALYSRAFEISGVSHMAVPDQSNKPTSGLGQQTRHDIESERFSIAAQEYERCSVQVAIQTIDRAKDIARDNPDYAAPAARDRYSLDYVDWSEIDMEGDEYEIGVFPSSALPNDPAGRQTRVESLFNAGLIQDPKTALNLLQFPDLEKDLSLERAASDLIDTILERIVDDGKYLPPEPMMDLNLALKKAQAHYNRAILRNVPEDRLRLVRKFLQQAFVLVQRAQAQEARMNAAIAGNNQQPTPAAGTPPAPGAAGAPPTAVQGESQ